MSLNIVFGLYKYCNSKQVYTLPKIKPETCGIIKIN